MPRRRSSALALGAALLALAPAPWAAAPLHVGDVVVALGKVSDGSLLMEPADIAAILAEILGADAPDAPTPDDLGTFLVELSAQLEALPVPRALGFVFVDFYAVGAPGPDGAQAVLGTLHVAAPADSPLGWEVAEASCTEFSGAAAPHPGVSGWYELDTAPLALVGLDLPGGPATLSNLPVSALLLPDAGPGRPFSLQGEADLSSAVTDPPGILGAFGVEALYVSGVMLTPEERAAPGVGDRLGAGCP